LISFNIPGDAALLAEIGKVAIRHGQLDYVLRMTIKTLAGLALRDAIDATDGILSSELRRHVRKLARERFGEVSTTYYRLDALLNRAHRATKRRNELLHGLWAADMEGRELFRHEGHQFIDTPTVPELATLAEELATIAYDLNTARLSGFLKDGLAPIDAAAPGEA
jgi:hypothetical protein